MKIGIFSPYLETMTGGEKYIFTAASCLSKEHQVSIFWNNPGILEKASDKFDLDLTDVKVAENIFDKSYPFYKRFYKSMSYDRIIYLSDGSLPLIYCKLLLHIQSPMEWVNTNSFLYLLKRARVTRIICNSYYTKKYIDRKFGGEASVLYPPADISKKDKFEKEKTILTVGRFNRLSNGTDFKKLGFLVESFKKFQKKRLKGWRMNIVTSVRKEEENEFEKFQKGIKSEFISVCKNADYKTIIGLYEKAMIYWHAAGYGENLEKHPEWAEHFGISTVEAMSNGAVPVVINAGGQPEIVKDGDNGFLWETQDELIKKTHLLATDKELFGKLQEEAIDAAGRFGKDRFCEELNHLIW